MFKSFTYDDYIKCIHTLRLNAVLELAEEKSNYNLHKKIKNHLYDNLIKDILNNTEKVASIINECLDLNYIIKEDELLVHKNSHIRRKNSLRYSDIIYKVNKKEVYFLIHHETEINTNIKLHILNNSIDIINDWCRENRFKENKKYPSVVPIIIYTGNEELKIEKITEEDKDSSKERNNIYGNYNVEIPFNFIDVQRTNNSYLKGLFDFIF